MIGEKRLNRRFGIKELLVLSILVLEDAGTFGFLPIGIANIIALFLGVLLLFENKKMQINKKYLLLIAYMLLITLFHALDIKSITNFVLFAVELAVFFMYVVRLDDFSKLENVILCTAVIISVIGLLQEMFYVMGVPFLTDMTKYGFPRQSVYPSFGRLARVSSLYSEPASLNGLLVSAFLILLINRSRIKHRLAKFLLLLAFTIFTQSTLIYFTFACAFVVYVLFIEKSRKSRFMYITLTILLVSTLLVFYGDFVQNVLAKFSTLSRASSDRSSDLSAFALVSNIRITFAKISDGHILGTGYNSHRFYYDSYIYNFYDEVYMKINNADAASLYIRVLSEFGLVGIIFLVYQIIRNFYLGKKMHNSFLMFCSIAFALSIVRDGNYIRTLNFIFISVLFLLDKKPVAVKLSKKEVPTSECDKVSNRFCF